MWYLKKQALNRAHSLPYHQQVLANGLSPVVNILRKCWHEPYLNPTTVQAALTFFSCWASVNDATPWRYVPLGPCVDEVVTLVAAQLSTAIADASKARNQGASDDGLISGGAAQVLLNALSAATRYVTILPESSSSCPIVPMLDAYPGVVSFRDQCVQLLTRWREVPLSPIAHLLAIASLDILFRAQENLNWNGNQRIAGGGDLVEGTPRHTLGNLSVSSAEEVVLSLLQNKLDGRISSHHGQHGKREVLAVFSRKFFVLEVHRTSLRMSLRICRACGNRATLIAYTVMLYNFA